MTKRFGPFPAVFGVMFVGAVAMAPAPAAAQAAGNAPTFSKDVAPVLYTHCTTCHRPGEIAPMSLLTYEQARPWARAIRDNVVNGVMPPWHADPAHGKWVNDRSMTQAEKDVIVRWVDAGAPQGSAADLPKAPVYAQGWTIGQPDAVVTMEREYAVPAQGEIPYQYFEMETNFTEDRWVQALEVRPGNREVVHHILVYARTPQMTRRPPVFRMQNPPGPLSPTQMKEMEEAKADPAKAKELRQRSSRRGNLIAQIAPGTNATVYAPGSAMLLEAGTVLTFQVHYTTNGAAATDRSRIGFKFASRAPSNPVYATAMMNPRFMIPAGAARHPVEARMEFLEDVTIYSLAPHTHLRGKAWEYTVTYPDGRSEIVLSVPTYDFNWQTDYVFATPLRLPKGSILKSVAHYDNSKDNPSSPDPTQPVYWGDQTWEEMQYTGIIYSVDKETRTTTAQQH
ncbi:MAG TPA: cytochrome c [Vicinamibacterales bacterium]|nr:cytochrome c [Vicinamibacterales bacterium]